MIVLKYEKNFLITILNLLWASSRWNWDIRRSLNWQRRWIKRNSEKIDSIKRKRDLTDKYEFNNRIEEFKDILTCIISPKKKDHQSIK